MPHTAPQSSAIPPSAKPRTGRRTPMAARGEPMIWLMGLALIICFLAVVTLVAKVAVEGANTFWPRPIDRVQVRDGSFPLAGRVFYGIPIREESFDATPEMQARIDALQAAGNLPADALDGEGRPIRRQYRAGNRDVTGQPFYWIPLADIAETTRPGNTVLLERTDWGPWLGTPRGVFRQVPVAADAAPTPGGGKRVERVTIDGAAYDRIYEVEGEDAVRDALPRVVSEAAHRRESLESLVKSEMGRVNDRTYRAQLRQREIDRMLPVEGKIAHAPWWPNWHPSWTRWSIILVLAAAAGFGARALSKRRSVTEQPPAQKLIAARVLAVLAVLAAVGVVVERPWREVALTPEQHAAASAEIAAEMERLRGEYQTLETRRKQLDADDAQWRIVVTDATQAAFAPLAQTEQEQPLKVSQIVRAVNPNTLSAAGKVGIYLDRWLEFLTADPRASNSEGGVFPVIVGTVLMTVLLSVIVVPFGVIAALYLREYARQGLGTSLLRIAINNLAGVPSIVFGMFGLGFFCSTIGQYIDTGPEVADRAAPLNWWAWAGATAAIIIAALVAAIFARPRPGQPFQRHHRLMGTVVGVLWFTAAGFAVYLAATTPYFDGFFAARPGSTFGSKGLLWASLTLALLTLPVVIVATEEAVAAVPRSMREGSYGCGASKWQTIWRIVLPGAMPGIMTGMILAMARGAGEVAPLMLVGAMKNVDKLPFSSDYPFLHAERSFMHLGFHIYDLGFQSPDAEAARPLVWTTTLLLLAIVVILNLFAILIRARLRAKSSGSGL